MMKKNMRFKFSLVAVLGMMLSSVCIAANLPDEGALDSPEAVCGSSARDVMDTTGQARRHGERSRLTPSEGYFDATRASAHHSNQLTQGDEFNDEEYLAWVAFLLKQDQKEADYREQKNKGHPIKDKLIGLGFFAFLYYCLNF